MFKKLFCSVAVAAGLLAVAAPASAGIVPMTDWTLVPGGPSNPSSAITVVNYLDITGAAFVQNTFTSGSTFNFNEAGTFNVFSADSNTIVSPYLTATFVGTGTGTTGGTLTFNPSGTLDVFSGSTKIGQFTVESGSAVLNANSVLPNGTVSIVLQADSLAAGYWFNSANVDLSTVANVTLGFATTNVIQSTVPVSSTIQNLFDANFGAPASFVGNGSTQLVLSNNGQYQLANNVPEPASIALVGLGLLGLGLARRRKA